MGERFRIKLGFHDKPVQPWTNSSSQNGSYVSFSKYPD